jgi:hypothetical protein
VRNAEFRECLKFNAENRLPLLPRASEHNNNLLSNLESLPPELLTLPVIHKRIIVEHPYKSLMIGQEFTNKMTVSRNSIRKIH